MTDIAASQEAQKFIIELEKVARKIAEKHGFSMPPFQSFENGDTITLNLGFYRGDPRAQWRSWYIRSAEAIGVDINWVNTSFRSHDGLRILTLIGLDPNGGDRCVIVEDEEKTLYHLSPAALSTLIARAQ